MFYLRASLLHKKTLQFILSGLSVLTLVFAVANAQAQTQVGKILFQKESIIEKMAHLE